MMINARLNRTTSNAAFVLMIALRASALPPSRTRRTLALCRRPIS